jgi:hypothetical protein
MTDIHRSQIVNNHEENKHLQFDHINIMPGVNIYLNTDRIPQSPLITNQFKLCTTINEENVECSRISYTLSIMQTFKHKK